MVSRNCRHSGRAATQASTILRLGRISAPSSVWKTRRQEGQLSIDEPPRPVCTDCINKPSVSGGDHCSLDTLLSPRRQPAFAVNGRQVCHEVPLLRTGRMAGR
jgi:hypothetical protein